MCVKSPFQETLVKTFIAAIGAYVFLGSLCHAMQNEEDQEGRGPFFPSLTLPMEPQETPQCSPLQQDPRDASQVLLPFPSINIVPGAIPFHREGDTRFLPSPGRISFFPMEYEVSTEYMQVWDPTFGQIVWVHRTLLATHPALWLYPNPQALPPAPFLDSQPMLPQGFHQTPASCTKTDVQRAAELLVSLQQPPAATAASPTLLEGLKDVAPSPKAQKKRRLSAQPQPPKADLKKRLKKAADSPQESQIPSPDDKTPRMPPQHQTHRLSLSSDSKTVDVHRVSFDKEHLPTFLSRSTKAIQNDVIGRIRPLSGPSKKSTVVLDLTHAIFENRQRELRELYMTIPDLTQIIFRDLNISALILTTGKNTEGSIYLPPEHGNRRYRYTPSILLFSSPKAKPYLAQLENLFSP